MKRRMVVLLTAICLAAAPVSVLAEETDYSYLEDMSVKELKALRSAIDELLGDEGTKESEKQNILDGTYYTVASYLTDKSKYYTFTPDNSEKTMGSYKANDWFGLTTGEYRITDDMLTINVIISKSGGDVKYDDVTYQIDGDYLIRTDYLCIGTIPDTDLFKADVTCTKISSWTGNIDYKYTFREDGTYEYSYFDYTYKGTYERKDNLLLLTQEDGTTQGILIINGQFYPHALIRG